MEDILKLYNNEHRYYKMVEDIVRAIESHSLFVFIGAGVSISQGYPDWNKYVDEFLRYWTYRLADLNTEKAVSREDLLFLNYIAESDMDKKRKIDLVHYLIREYLPDKKEVNKVLLNFEKMYFKDMEPINKINKVLEELVKLEATFITTNYDSQIAEHSKREWGKTFELYENVSKLNGRIPAHSIIHLHGQPDGNPDYFINSSSSYSRMYYERNESFDQFRQIIQSDVKPMILFIGCSMEEEEIMAFLNKQTHSKEGTKYYALMKYDKHPSFDRTFNEHIYQFYKNEKNIEFIWYGTSHNQLPILVEDLVTRVRENLMSEKEREIQLIRNNADDTVSILNKAYESSDFYFLSKVFEMFLNEEESVIREFFTHLFNSNIILDRAVENTVDYVQLWQLFEEKLELLHESEKEILFSFIKNVQSIHLESIIIVGRIILQSKYNNYDGKKEYLRLIYNGISGYQAVKELNDDDLFCLYLNGLLINRSRAWTEKKLLQDGIVFNYHIDSFQDLMQSLTKLDHETNYYDFEYNMELTNLSLLYYCIQDELLQYNKSHDFPDEFYKNRVIQKIFVNLGLNIPDEEKSVNLHRQIDKVKSKINFDDKLMGQEMNEFYAKHYPDQMKEEDFYIDGIEAGEISSVEFSPYLNISELLSLSTDEIVDVLEGSDELTPLDGKGFWKSKYVSGQSDTFNELFTSEAFEKYEEKMREVLNLLIENDILRERYGANIVTFFTKDKSRILDNKDSLHVFLKEMQSIHFTWLEKKVYEYIISEGLYFELDYFYELIASYDITKFEGEIKDDEGFIDTNKFINTSLGRFVDVFQHFDSESTFAETEYYHLLGDYIEKLDGDLKHYLQGSFLNINHDDIVSESIHFFQGAVHFNRIDSNSDMEKFKYIVEPIFTGLFNDDYCLEEVSKILVHYYRPNDIAFENINYLKKVSDMMFRWLELNLSEIKYGEDWFTEFIKHEMTAKGYLEQLIYSLDRIPDENFTKIINIIERNLNDSISIESYHVDMTIAEQKDLTKHARLVKALLERNIIDNDILFLSRVEMLLYKLHDANQVDMVRQLLSSLRGILTEDDHRNLSIKFREL